MNENSCIESEELIEIMRKYPKEKRYTLAILQDIQRKYSYISEESMNCVAEYLSIPLSSVYSISTFYKALSLNKKGKYEIKVCSGTACHIRGSKNIIEEIKNILDINPGETTKDGLFSIEVVNCLGACALAPVMVVNGTYYGNMTKEKVRAIINEYREACTNE